MVLIKIQVLPCTPTANTRWDVGAKMEDPLSMFDDNFNISDSEMPYFPYQDTYADYQVTDFSNLYSIFDAQISYQTEPNAHLDNTPTRVSHGNSSSISSNESPELHDDLSSFFSEDQLSSLATTPPCATLESQVPYSHSGDSSMPLGHRLAGTALDSWASPPPETPPASPVIFTSDFKLFEHHTVMNYGQVTPGGSPKDLHSILRKSTKAGPTTRRQSRKEMTAATTGASDKSEKDLKPLKGSEAKVKKPTKLGRPSKKTTLEDVATRREAFLKRNKESAYKCRVKKKTEWLEAAERVKVLTEDNASKGLELEELRSEISGLKRLLLLHYRGSDYGKLVEYCNGNRHADENVVGSEEGSFEDMGVNVDEEGREEPCERPSGQTTVRIRPPETAELLDCLGLPGPPGPQGPHHPRCLDEPSAPERPKLQWPSSLTTIITITITMRHLTPSTLQTIDISLSDDDPSAKPPSSVHTYTTYDDIHGYVDISALAPTPFSRVEICLLGTTRTIQSDHTGPIIDVPRVANIFLRMDMPVPPSAYPPPFGSNDGSNDTYLLNPGSPLHIPFHFVVPARLLPHACRHELFSPSDSESHTQHSVSEAHTQLPPSLGSFSLPRDDLAFDMANISYSIYARLLAPSPANKPPKALSFAQRKFHIVPAGEEAPPLLVLKESQYVLSESKTMRKGMFRGKLGTLTLTTTQPRAFSLPPPHTCGPHTSSALTDLTLTLRFDPASPSCAPPRLGALSAWISATTVHSISPASRIPNQELKGTSYDDHSRALKTFVALAEEVPAAEAPLWRAVRAPKYARRDSGYSSAGSLSPAYSPSSSPAPSTASTGLVSASDEDDENVDPDIPFLLRLALLYAPS
ncbi:hypothetical protein V493_06923 [Pseudogymnoascus sp. VKM F-4281 (FW-2241)]|nr:hypothetical protein V493_06923 [Pseudogymnoascus sp. VKM F-4281 (FW-2241)]